MSETKSDSFSFVDAELKTLEFWKEKDIFKQSLNKTKNNAPYIFYDGPPFATGLPHHMPPSSIDLEGYYSSIFHNERFLR